MQNENFKPDYGLWVKKHLHFMSIIGVISLVCSNNPNSSIFISSFTFKKFSYDYRP